MGSRHNTREIIGACSLLVVVTDKIYYFLKGAFIPTKRSYGAWSILNPPFIVPQTLKDPKYISQFSTSVSAKMDVSPVQSGSKCSSDFSIERILSDGSGRREENTESPNWLCCTRYQPPRIPR